MERMRRYRPSPAMVVALAALTVAAGGVTYGAIPDSDDAEIHACYIDRFTRSRPLFRVIDAEAGQTCRSGEKELVWNQQGPPGPSSVRPLGDVTLSDGEEKVLVSEGALTFTATCRIDRPMFVDDEALITISTTQEHSTFAPVLSNTSPELVDFGPSTEAGERRVLSAHNSAGELDHPVNTAIQFDAAAPDGTRLSGVLSAAVHVLGRQDKCIFGGHVVVG